MIRKLYVALMTSLALLMAGNVHAACARMNIYNSGYAVVPPGSDTPVYGPFSVSCAGMHQFNFEDLSGHSQRNVLRHILEQQQWDGEWRVYSVFDARRMTTVSRRYYLPIGNYRYTVKNIGTGNLQGWSLEGSVTTFSIPLLHW